MTETLEQACKRVQREYRAGFGKKDALARAAERRRVFAQAIQRGVSYRRLAEVVGLAPGTVYEMVRRMGIVRAPEVDPFSEPAWEES